MINIYKPKLTILQQRIFRLLCMRTGIFLNAHRISQVLQVSQAGVSKALPLLEKEGLITVSKDADSKRLAITLNREYHHTVWLKRVDNLNQVYESGLVQFFFDSYSNATVILFGSYASGEDNFSSDIDIALLGVTDKNIDLTKFNTLLERTIHINYYLSLKKLNNPLLSNLCNGIILKGAIEL